MSMLMSEMTSKTLDNSNTEEQINDPGFFKVGGAKPKFQTKICDHWRRSGNCSYGDSCWYAHGEDDLRKLNGPRSARIDEKMNKENEKPMNRRSNQIFLDNELANAVNFDDVPKEGMPPTKRTSTNVKGLTVTIPPNIAFKEQVTNDSLPLSPAQERWISMSCGAPNNEKGETVTVTTTASNETENGDFEKKQTLESAFDRRPPAGQFMRNNEEILPAKQDDFGFLSPNPNYPFNGRIPQNGHVHSHHRSFSRGPHQRATHGPPFSGGSNLPSGQHQARISRSGTSGLNANTGFEDPRSSFIPRASSLIRSGGTQPQIQQACWNLAGDLFQRQKDMETSGVMRGPMDHQHQQQQHQQMSSSRKFEELELSRLLAAQQQQQQQQQQKRQETMAEIARLKDLAFLRYQLERGAIRKHQVPRELFNELISNLPLLNQHQLAHGHGHGGPKSHGPAKSDCSCGGTVQKQQQQQQLHPSEHVSLHSHFARQQAHNQAIHHHQSHHHHNQHQHQMSQQQQNQLRRFGFSAPITSELSAPPKMFESLLPSDDSFSIWLDPKPKKEPSTFLREPQQQPPPRHIQIPTESEVSLLVKMEALRSGRCPISEEEMKLSHGPPRAKRSDRDTSSSNGSSPMSLMQLLSSENLLPSANNSNKAKTTMFDFDSLKIAETLRLTPQSSRHTSTSGKSESPRFFGGDEKPNNGYEDVSSGLFTPLSANNPSFMERCDFFAASGSCPFGDGCNQSHAVPDQQKHELMNAL